MFKRNKMKPDYDRIAELERVTGMSVEQIATTIEPMREQPSALRYFFGSYKWAVSWITFKPFRNIPHHMKHHHDGDNYLCGWCMCWSVITGIAALCLGIFSFMMLGIGLPIYHQLFYVTWGVGALLPIPPLTRVCIVLGKES